MQVAFFCFRQGVAGISRNLGRDVPDLEKLNARKLWADFSFPMTTKANRASINKKTHKQIFHGIVQGYPGTVPGLSRHFPWNCFYVFPFFPRKT